MPGRLVNKSGEGFPPDWIQIGYSSTPISVIKGFNTAIAIKNWINNREDWQTSFNAADFPDIMYFPGNAVLDIAGMTSFEFKDTPIEYINITFPDTLYTIEEMFTNCTSLRYAKIRFEDGITIDRYGPTFMKNCINLYECDIDISNLTTLESINSAWENCSSLKSINLSNDSIQSASNTFKDCTALEDVTIRFPAISNANSMFLNSSSLATNSKYDVDMGANSTVSDYTNAFKGAKITDRYSNIYLRKGANFVSAFEGATVTGWIETTHRGPTYTGDYSSCFKGATINTYTTIDFGHTEDFNITGICDSMFENAHIYRTLDSLDINPSSANSMFKGCHFDNIETPGLCQGIYTGYCTDFTSMFEGSDVKRIYGLKFYNATTLTDMFKDTEMYMIYVNQLLLDLIASSTYSGTKTLAELGFTEATYPAADIQNLANYTAFIGAGWSIGY